MATNRLEGAKTNGEAAKPGAEGAKPEAGAAAAAPAAKAGGLGAWLPLAAVLVLMPALAYATTMFLILPKLQKSLGQPAAAEPAAAEAEKAEKSEKHGGEEKSGKEGGGKVKSTVQLTKVLVNVAGSMGTRYLMTSLTLVSTSPNFKARVEENKDQLLDLATSTLGTKTISDLEKPGARNLIRTELISVFNNALGAGVVQELYIPEFAIQ